MWLWIVSRKFTGGNIRTHTACYFCTLVDSNFNCQHFQNIVLFMLSNTSYRSLLYDSIFIRCHLWYAFDRADDSVVVYQKQDLVEIYLPNLYNFRAERNLRNQKLVQQKAQLSQRGRAPCRWKFCCQSLKIIRLWANTVECDLCKFLLVFHFNYVSINYQVYISNSLAC